MAKLSFTTEDRTRYVPEAFDNRADLDDCWWADLLPLTGRDLAKANGQAFRGAKQSDLLARAESLVKRIISEYVPAIGNLRIETSPGQWQSPRNGAELYDMVVAGPPVYGVIVDELYDALKDNSKASEGDLGKLQRPSGLSEPAVTPLAADGDAADVRTTTTQAPMTYNSQAETATE